MVAAPLIYIDANVFMYAVEGDEILATPIKDLLALLQKNPRLAVTSELTLAEVLPKADPDHRSSYLNLIIWSGIFDLQPITREILIETARYRRDAKMLMPDGREVMPRIPDAIRVVTAIKKGCQQFLSDDKRLKVPPEIALVKPDQAGLATLSRVLS